MWLPRPRRRAFFSGSKKDRRTESHGKLTGLFEDRNFEFRQDSGKFEERLKLEQTLKLRYLRIEANNMRGGLVKIL